MQDSHQPDASLDARSKDGEPGDQKVRRALTKDYMTKNPICLTRDMTLLQAVKVLLDNDISGAPVVEKYEEDEEGAGRLVGVLSEEDFLWKEVESTDQSIADTFRDPYLWSLMTSDGVLQEAVEMQALKVELSMSDASISVCPETPMVEAASIMLDAKVKRLPVVAPRPEGRSGLTVVGIVSRKDVLRHVVMVMEKAHRGTQPEQTATAG